MMTESETDSSGGVVEKASIDSSVTTKPTKRIPFRRQISIWAQARQSAFGVMLCILCAFAYSTNSFLSKLLMATGAASPYFVALSRQFFIVVFILPVIGFSETKLANSPQLNKHWKAIAVRCIFGSSSLIYYVGLYFASLADIGVIFTSSLPVFSGILARIFLGERFRYTDFVFMIITATGVLLILRPPYIFPSEMVEGIDEDDKMMNRLIGGGCALLSAMCQSMALLGARACVGEVHYSAIVFWNCLTGWSVSFIVMLMLDAYQAPCDGMNRLLVVISALSGMVGQASTTLAVRYISPVIASLSASIELAFLFFYQTSLLGHFPHFYSIIGSAIIIFTMVTLVLRSWLTDKLYQKQDCVGSAFAPGSKHYKVLSVLTK